MDTPKFYDIRNDNDALRFELSPTKPTQNSNGVPARDFLLSRCFKDRKGVQPQFMVLHTQDGYTPGSLKRWVAEREMGKDGKLHPVEASSTVMVQKDGSILRVIPEEHGPWTNGLVQKPTAQSAQLRALAGTKNLNLFCLTIEAEGKPNDVMPEPEFRAVLWRVRDWMERYDIPLDNILPHSSIDSVDRGHCPGDYYHRVMAALRYPEPVPPPRYDGQPKTVNDVVFHPFKRRVTSTGANQRLWAFPTAPLTGPTIPAGQKIETLYWIKGEPVDGNDIWLVEESGPRIWSGGVEEAVP
jgi:N-acetyl-anhydromuramyl-L-alanine amidase AmpD